MHQLSRLTVPVIIASLLVVAGTLHSSGAGLMSEGCMKQWMFNGVWRVQVTKVEPFMDGSQQVGWQVTESWRNGTRQEIAPGDSLLKDEVLELQDGSSIAASATSTGGLSMNAIGSHTLAQAAQFTYVQVFRAPAAFNPATKPKAVTVLFDGDKLSQFKSRPQFTTHAYNYRIKLDCEASGAHTAQGGSFEIPAVQGCMNQWMSNGLWRVRATAIAPYSTGGPQDGWKVTEDWTSLAKQQIAAGDTNISVQQLVLANGDTLESDAGVITSGSFYQLASHVFAPGSSHTYEQLFIQIPFTPDKPVKLIVTFNAATENTIASRPHYKVDPPNFRINLECTK